ncbi:MAG: alkaline phosphatase family protein [Planctomycetes bacterium]|nr:alkaline phosphatase family protein [Planctomycetota bacterium]
MRLPRWTVWPALGVLFVFAIPGIPRRGEPQPGSAPAAGASFPRVLVLGIDGLDPDVLAQVIADHPERMRNFAAVVGEGGINRLQTSTPPQSPVAWSNFITGLDPGGHGIFDFIHRDPRTRDVATSITKAEDPKNLELGSQYQLPLGGDPQSNRTGEAFWQILAEHGVPADVWRMPANFPVVAADGWSFSGMMTPAIDSAYGEYHLFTTVPSADAVASAGKIELVNRFGNRITARLPGPPNPFHQDGKQVTIPIEISIDPQAGAAVVETCGTALVLKPGQWSDFVRVSFPLLPAGASSVAGTVRFYLRGIEPFELYASPVNIDPLDPIAPVSAPKSASAEVAQAIGLYYTQGMPEDVNALKDRALSDDEFMQQSNLVHDEGARMLDYALARWKANPRGGFLFFYFSGVDLCCHMMWRHEDEQHPFHDTRFAAGSDEDWTHRPGSTWREVLEDIYLRMDPALGRIRESMPRDTLLVVMSDHGFASWRRKFNLNTWLEKQGYLVLKPGAARGNSTYIQSDVDWSRSRAYGIGFNGLYLNLAGREGEPGKDPGIVQKGAEADVLLAEIKAKLEAERDPKFPDAQPILRVDRSSEIYHGARLEEAPDLLVGYNAGYGNSDASTLGRIPEETFEDNLGGTFNGNHLMAPEVVEGTLLTNGKVLPGRHGLEDLTVEILKQFGIQPGAGMRGRPVLR